MVQRHGRFAGAGPSALLQESSPIHQSTGGAGVGLNAWRCERAALSASPTRLRWLEFAVVAAAALLIVLLFVSRMDPHAAKPDWDRPIDYHKYLFMAQHPFELRTAPYCYRLAVPTLLGVVPGDLQTVFVVFNALAVAATLVAIYATGRALGWSVLLAAAAGLSAAAVGPFMRGGLAGYPSVDPASWLVLALGFLLIVRRRDTWFMVLLVIGTLTKETALFLIPLHYGMNARYRIELPAMHRTFRAAAPALLVFLALRTAMPPLNEDAAYLQRMPVQLTHVHAGTSHCSAQWCFAHLGLPKVARLGTLKFWYDVTVTPFGPLLFMVLYGLVAHRAIRELFIRALPFVTLAFAAVFFAVATGRMMVVALPVFAILAAGGLSRLAVSFGLPRGVVLLLPVLQMLAILLFPTRNERYLSFDQTLAVCGAFLSMCAVAKLDVGRWLDTFRGFFRPSIEAIRSPSGSRTTS
jgi:hypothetical protein